MTTAISDTRAKAVYRVTDAPVTDDNRKLCVGIVLGDVISLRPERTQREKRVPIAAIFRHADMLVSDNGPVPKLTAMSDFAIKDGPHHGRVVVTLLHGDTFTFRVEGTKTELVLPLSSAYLAAAKRKAESDVVEKAAARRARAKAR
jgi:hypothetical protein